MAINNPSWQANTRPKFKPFPFDVQITVEDVQTYLLDEHGKPYGEPIKNRVRKKRQKPPIDPNLKAHYFDLQFCLDNNIPLQEITNFSFSDNPVAEILKQNDLANDIDKKLNDLQTNQELNV